MVQIYDLDVWVYNFALENIEAIEAVYAAYLNLDIHSMGEVYLDPFTLLVDALEISFNEYVMLNYRLGGMQGQFVDGDAVIYWYALKRGYYISELELEV